MRPGCGEHSDPPRSPLEQLARRFLAPPSQGLRGLRMDEALERRQLDARPGASARGHVPTVPRLCPHPAHLRPSHIAATGCRSRPHGARMVSDGLRECGPQASNLRVGGSTPSGRTTRDGTSGALFRTPRHRRAAAGLGCDDSGRSVRRDRDESDVEEWTRAREHRACRHRDRVPAAVRDRRGGRRRSA